MSKIIFMTVEFTEEASVDVVPYIWLFDNSEGGKVIMDIVLWCRS